MPLTFVDDASGGQAVDFRGDGRRELRYIDTGLTFPQDTAKTYSLFVKTEDFENELVWIGNGAPDGDAGPDGNRLYLGVQEQTVFAGVGVVVYRRNEQWPVRDGNWHHYALRVTGDSGTFDAFQDGNLVVDGADYRGSTASDSGEGTYGTPRDFLIGMGGGGVNHPANAIVDDVAVFEGELSDAQIAEISAAGSVRNWLEQ